MLFTKRRACQLWAQDRGFVVLQAPSPKLPIGSGPSRAGAQPFIAPHHGERSAWQGSQQHGPVPVAICSRGRQDHSLPPSGAAARPPDEWKRLSRALGNWFSIASRLTNICFFPSASHIWERRSVGNWFLSPLSSSFLRTRIAATTSSPLVAGGKLSLRCLCRTGCSGPVVSEPSAAGG